MENTILYDESKIDDETSQSNVVKFLENKFKCIDLSKSDNLVLDSNHGLFFNLVDSGFVYASGEEFIPQLLKLKDKNFIGSTSETLRIASNKLVSKLLLKKNSIIKIPKFTIYEPGINISNDILNINFFPVIVKPIHTVASIGINKDSIKHNLDELLSHLSKYKKEAIIIEEYISGDECTVSGIGNLENLHILPVLWYLNTNKEKVLTFKAKWKPNSNDYKEYIRKMSAPDTSIKKIMKEIQIIFKIHDYIKADFIKRDEDYYLIDISPNPTITPKSSFLSQFSHENNKEGVRENLIDLFEKIFTYAKTRLNS